MPSKSRRSGRPRKSAAPRNQDTEDTFPTPLIFISHDTRDADLAEAFATLLTDSSGGILKSFRSSDKSGTQGIEFGTEWYRAIMDKLDEATDVVALLTNYSLDRPWILYESGVAKGKLNKTVLGLALGVPLAAAAKGPFAQFQNSGDDEDSVTKLVLQLIRRNPDADPREEAVRRQVQAFKKTVESLLALRPTAPVDSNLKEEDPSIAKLFEEIKLRTRDIPEILNRVRQIGITTAESRVLATNISQGSIRVSIHKGKVITLDLLKRRHFSFMAGDKEVMVVFGGSWDKHLMASNWPDGSLAQQYKSEIANWFLADPTRISTSGVISLNQIKGDAFPFEGGIYLMRFRRLKLSPT